MTTQEEPLGSSHGVVHPFAPPYFPSALREDAATLWVWYEHLGIRYALDDVDPQVAHEATEVCKRHDLDRTLLTCQLDIVKIRNAGVRFDTYRELDDVMVQWPIAHGRLISALAGFPQTWQRQMIDEMSRAWFLTNRMVNLPREVRRGELWIAQDELQALGVSPEELRNGQIDENQKKVIWKQLVRIRDRMVRAQPLVRDLSRRYRRPFKLWWFGTIELLDQIERREFDLWSSPIELTQARQITIQLQSILTRAGFKRV